MPTRHGKSETAKAALAHILVDDPGIEVIYACHTQALAEKHSREVQNKVRALGKRFLGGRDVANVKHWITEDGSQFRAVGAEAGLSGYTGHLIVCDDLVKEMQMAKSPVQMENLTDWFLSTLLERRTKRHGRKAPIVLTQTIWGEAEIPILLANVEKRLAERGEANLMDRFLVISLPAIAEEDGQGFPWPDHWEVSDDPRSPGEILCEEIRGLDETLRIRERLFETGKSHVWHAMHQQNPLPPEGRIIKREWFENRIKSRDDMPKVVRWYRGWDFAFTEGGGDYTCSILAAIDNKRVRWIIPTIQEQASPVRGKAIIRKTLEEDPAGTIQCMERAHAALAMIADLYQEGVFKGHSIVDFHPTKKKLDRAANWIEEAASGRVMVVCDSSYENTLVEEMIRCWCNWSGEDGEWDDWVDAMSAVDHALSQVKGRSEDNPDIIPLWFE